MTTPEPIEQVSLDKIIVTNKVPDRVDAAVKLLCLAILFSIISLVMNIALGNAPLETGGMALLCVSYAVIGWLVLKISLGRNWARITVAMVLALEIGRAPILLPASFKVSIVLGLLDTLSLGLQIAAMVMLFMKDAEGFFEKKTG